MSFKRIAVSLADLVLVAAASEEGLFLDFGPRVGQALEAPVRDLHLELDG